MPFDLEWHCGNDSFVPALGLRFFYLMKHDSKMRGVILMVLSSVAFCAMSAMIKIIPDIDSYKTTLFRFMIGMAVMGTAAQFGRIQLRFVNSPLLLLRGVCHGAGVFLFFLSISKIGLAKGTIISNSSPIFATVLSVIFLRDKIAWWQWLALTVAVFGLYLLFLAKGAGTGYSLTLGVYELLALGGALLSGLSAVVIKRLHATDSTYSIFFSQCVIGLWLMIVPANVVPCAIGYFGGAILLGVGILASIGQLLMTQGYRYTSVSVGSLLGLLLPVFNLFVGLVFFHEHLSELGLIGSALVLGACLIVMTINGKLEKSSSHGYSRSGSPNLEE